MLSADVLAAPHKVVYGGFGICYTDEKGFKPACKGQKCQGHITDRLGSCSNAKTEACFASFSINWHFSIHMCWLGLTRL